jgi:pyridoxal phosphate enzyme (YggS family)
MVNSSLTETIRHNLEYVQERMARAAMRSGRTVGDVRLVVVSKAQSLSVVQAAFDAGVRLFGENYPEESLPKIEALQGRGVFWHMIGHLQSRKIRIVCQSFDMLHSLDRVSLALKLEQALKENGRVLPCLLELNVSGEESKFGFDVRASADFLKSVAQIVELPHLELRGLMTMPPLMDDPEDVRPYFARLRQWQEILRREFPAVCWDELSMGTSADFEQAIIEGATYVRIGQAILGPRLRPA